MLKNFQKLLQIFGQEEVDLVGNIHWFGVLVLDWEFIFCTNLWKCKLYSITRESEDTVLPLIWFFNIAVIYNQPTYLRIAHTVSQHWHLVNNRVFPKWHKSDISGIFVQNWHVGVSAKNKAASSGNWIHTNHHYILQFQCSTNSANLSFLACLRFSDP